VEDINTVDRELASVLQDGDVLLTLGAGNIGRVAAGLPQKLQQAA
jgi:UDP-N-acetylmuramate--alanine ligase